MGIIDSHFTSINRESVSLLCYRFEVLSENQVEMVCFVEQVRYRSPLNRFNIITLKFYPRLS